MGEKNKGNFRRISEAIFKRVTRKKAKERINNEFKKYVKKEEKDIGEKLSKEELKELRKDFFEKRGKKIIEEEAKKARGKATILALAGVIGVGGYALGTHNSKIPGITDGRTTIEVDMNEVEKDVDITNIEQQEKEDKHAVFVKELQDAALNLEDGEEIKQEETREEIISEEIQGLNSEEAIDSYLANIYVEAYKQKTGNEELNASDIQISKNSENYVYVLDDGKIVSHGDVPYETEKQLEADEKSHTDSRNDVEIYTVNLIKTGEAIDEMTTKLEKVIPGENYTNMKDYDSVLVDIGEITQKSFELKKLLKELKNNPNNEYIEGMYKNKQDELVESVIEFDKEKSTSIVQENQTKENAEDEMELL